MIYRTCTGCIAQGQPCDTRKEIRTLLAGIGATSIKWKCKQRVARIQISDPVWALTVESSGSVDDEGGPIRDYFPGIAVKDCGTKMLVFIETGALGRGGEAKFESSNRGFCKLPLSRITRRDGEREFVCRHCNSPASKGCDDFCGGR